MRASTAVTVSAISELAVPLGYRDRYAFLGAWSVAGDGGTSALHVVYASPRAAEAFRASGHFQDDAIIVKEVFEATTVSMTTGAVSRAGKLKGWFVMVRDGHNEHSSSRLWGDGWGWAWFDAANPTRTTSVDYKSDCQGCHLPAKSADWIYLDGYPALRR